MKFKQGDKVHIINENGTLQKTILTITGETMVDTAGDRFYHLMKRAYAVKESNLKKVIIEPKQKLMIVDKPKLNTSTMSIYNKLQKQVLKAAKADEIILKHEDIYNIIVMSTTRLIETYTNVKHFANSKIIQKHESK